MAFYSKPTMLIVEIDEQMPITASSEDLFWGSGNPGTGSGSNPGNSGHGHNQGNGKDRDKFPHSSIFRNDPWEV